MGSKNNEISILGVKITITPKSELLKKLESDLKKNNKNIIFTPNPEILVKAHKDKKFRDILNFSDMNIPDGVGISIASNFLHSKQVKRIRGREFMLDLLNIASKKNYKVFFLGASEEVNVNAVKKASRAYKNAKFEGTSDVKNSLNQINKFGPHMLFVALGAPKQEKYIFENLKNTKVKLVMAVGGSLDFFVGKQVLAPTWVSRGGLEWLWRLSFDPRRIKRIFNAVVVFPILVLLDNKSN